MIDLNSEMAWITFIDDGWETKWHPVFFNGSQMEWDSKEVMTLCRKRFNIEGGWRSFGIAPTSQMILRNAVRDNL